jgi:phage baseplate assembly protein W
MPLIDRDKSTSRAFKDISLAFQRHPVTNDIGSFASVDSIKRSVQNLVRTRSGERFFNPLIGGEVDDSLFELADSYTANTLQEEIYTLLENFEPRIRNVDVVVVFPIDTNELNVTIRYDVVGLQLPRQEIDFILQSTRE